MTARTESLRTHNSAWGFYGTVRHHADPDQAWGVAMRRLVEVTAFSAEAVHDVLDSRRGRHFVGDVNGFLFKGLDLDDAIEAAIERWMGWRTWPAPRAGGRHAGRNAVPGRRDRTLRIRVGP